MKDYGKAMKILRKRAGLTQAQLAEKLNVTYPTVSKWENGVNTPDISSIEKICSVFSVSVSEYLQLAEDDAASGEAEVTPRAQTAVTARKTNSDFPYIITAIVMAVVIVISSVLIGVFAFGNLSPSDIYDKVNPSVFCIEVKTDSNTLAGSGFFIDGNGTAVTNYHVIDGINSAKVRLCDGKTYAVDKIVGLDSARDIAIIHVDISKSKAVKLGNSNRIKVGESVYAIGYPESFTLGSQDSTFTQGIISKVAYEVEGVNYIQSTVDITNGNSGGVLVNSKGQVIGITTAGIRLGSANYMNMSVPINTMKSVKRDVNLSIRDFVNASKKTYTITYMLGDEVYATKKISELENVPNLSPEIAHGSFEGWYTDPEFTVKYTFGKKADGDFILYGKYSVKKIEYTVKYYDAQSKQTKSETYRFGEKHVLPTDTFTRDGYDLTAWEYEGKKYTAGKVAADFTDVNGSEVTLQAVWEPHKYTVSFDGNGADSGFVESITCGTGENFTLPSNGFTRTGYKFAGWMLDGGNYAEGASVTMTSAGDVTVKARWTPITYTVTFFSTNGGNSYDVTYTYDEKHIAPEGTFAPYSGHRFVGWGQYTESKIIYKPGDVIPDLTTKEGDSKVMYTQWELVTVHIVFDDTDVTGGHMDDMLVPCNNQKYKLPANGYVRDGYVFCGWQFGNTVVDAEDNVFFESSHNGIYVGKNTTVYSDDYTASVYSPVVLRAIWRECKYDGEGTEQSPYLIDSYEDLAYLYEFADGRTTSAAYYLLTADIDCQGKELHSVGAAGWYGFYGTFDGGNHVIRNATMAATGNYKGLFGNVWKGKICNVGIENYVIEGKDNCGVFAPLVGSYSSEQPLENCYAVGTISIGNLYRYESISGLVGDLRARAINCYASADIDLPMTDIPSGPTTEIRIGGFAASVSCISGYAQDIRTGTSMTMQHPGASNCYADARIHVGQSESSHPRIYAGLFVGRDNSGSYSGEKSMYDNCFVTGRLTLERKAGNYEGIFMGYKHTCTGTAIYICGEVEYGTPQQYTYLTTIDSQTETELENLQSLAWLAENMEFDASVWQENEGGLPTLKAFGEEQNV